MSSQIGNGKDGTKLEIHRLGGMYINLFCVIKAVFVLSTLQEIEADDVTNTLVLCHTRELAYQICQEFNRFKKYLPGVKVAVLYGGHPVRDHRRMLKEETPNIVVGTPGRTLAMVKEGLLKIDKLKRFILDECDSLLQSTGMLVAIRVISTELPS